MACPHCDKTIPVDAVFCIYCGTRLQQPPAARRPVDDAPPATGRTINLGRERGVPPPPPQQRTAPRRQPAPRVYQQVPVQPAPTLSRRRQGGFGWLWVLLFALLLFNADVRLSGGFPGLLILLGLLVFLKRAGDGRHDAAVQGLVWLTGLGLLFATGTFWPGILIVWGISLIMKR
jgi:hypothetical protein